MSIALDTEINYIHKTAKPLPNERKGFYNILIILVYCNVVKWI